VNSFCVESRLMTFDRTQAGTATWLLSLLTVQLALTHHAARKVTALRPTAGLLADATPTALLAHC